MKILTDKQYRKLLDDALIPWSDITYKERCATLEKELAEAKELKSILEKFDGAITTLFDGSYLRAVSGGGYALNLPDNVLVYENDILGGQVIKQEGIKCLIIDTDGNVKTGLTKQKADKGYKYKLVRKYG